MSGTWPGRGDHCGYAVRSQQAKVFGECQHVVDTRRMCTSVERITGSPPRCPLDLHKD
jgi:hypothetical protein